MALCIMMNGVAHLTYHQLSYPVQFFTRRSVSKISFVVGIDVGHAFAFL